MNNLVFLFIFCQQGRRFDDDCWNFLLLCGPLFKVFKSMNTLTSSWAVCLPDLPSLFSIEHRPQFVPPFGHIQLPLSIWWRITRCLFSQFCHTDIYLSLCILRALSIYMETIIRVRCVDIGPEYDVFILECEQGTVFQSGRINLVYSRLATRLT